MHIYAYAYFPVLLYVLARSIRINMKRFRLTFSVETHVRIVRTYVLWRAVSSSRLARAQIDVNKYLNALIRVTVSGNSHKFFLHKLLENLCDTQLIFRIQIARTFHRIASYRAKYFFFRKFAADRRFKRDSCLKLTILRNNGIYTRFAFCY